MLSDVNLHYLTVRDICTALDTRRWRMDVRRCGAAIFIWSGRDHGNLQLIFSEMNWFSSIFIWSRQDHSDLHLIPSIFIRYRSQQSSHGLNRLQSSSVPYHYWHLTVILSLPDNHIAVSHQLLQELRTFVTLQRLPQCYLSFVQLFHITLVYFCTQTTSAHAPSIVLLEEGRTSQARPTETTPCLTTEMTVADANAQAGHPQHKAPRQHARTIPYFHIVS